MPNDRPALPAGRPCQPTPVETIETIETTRTIVRPVTKEIVTDADGHFEVDIPPGTVGVTISVVGYVLSKREVKVGPDQTVDLTIPLTEGTGSYTEEVNVTGERYTRTETGVPTEQTLGSADLQNLKSTLADDPMRAVQTLPGVANSDDFKSEFAIRGSDFRHVGVTLDGVPSPLLLHTVHGVTDSGSLAMINSDILDSVTLLSGSYPQRYGNRTGATIDFRTREGSRDRPHVRLAASAINASGVAEGPIGKGRRGSWLISARKSYLDWLVQRIDPGITGTFGFVDAHGKFAYDLSPAHTLHTNVVVGRSRFHEREREYGLNSLDVGLNRAVLINTSLRSALSPSMVVTQRVYGVSGRFRNLNPLGEEIAHGDDRDLSYRVELTNSLGGGLLLESGAHLQWLKGDALERTFDDDRRVRPVVQRVGVASGGVRASALAGAAVPDDLAGRARRSLVADRSDAGLAVGAGGNGAAPLLPDRWRHRRLSTGARSRSGVRPARPAEQRHRTRLARRHRHWPARGRVAVAGGRVRARGIRHAAAAGHRAARHERILRAGVVRVALAERLARSRARPGAVPAAAQHEWIVRLDRLCLRGDALSRYDPRRGVHRGCRSAAYVQRLRLVSHQRSHERLRPLPRRLQRAAGRLSARHNDRYFLTSTRNELRLPSYSRLDLRATRTYAVAEGRLSLFVEVINLYNRRNVRARSIRLNQRRMEAFNVTEEMFPILPSVGIMVEF